MSSQDQSAPHNTGQPTRWPFLRLPLMNPKFAFDRSVRTVDVDGRLRVQVSRISKANICPYYGREIPGHAALGLEPDRVYQLLRDPAELALAADSFNHLPILSRHVPVTADDHQPDLVVGSTGTDAAFDGTYLTNSLVIWQAVAIAGIESGEQKELSCAYRYTPVMTPGVYEGVAYDGLMTNIQGNHVALVPQGRAGPSVVVGDANPFIKPPTENPPMKNPKRVARLTAALIAGLQPLMALDASIKPDEFAGKLALALDAESDKDDEDDKKKPAADSDEQGPDECDADYKKRMAEKDKPAQDAKAAMDAAIATASSKARTEAVAQMQAIRQAEKEVQPLIGEVVAQDSAAAVYKLALDHAKVDLAGVPEVAYGAMVRMLPKPGALRASPSMAADSAAAAQSVKALFPNYTTPARS